MLRGKKNGVQLCNNYDLDEVSEIWVLEVKQSKTI